MSTSPKLEVDVYDEGWLKKAETAIASNRMLIIQARATDAVAIADRMRRTIAMLPTTGVFKEIVRHLPSTGNLGIDPLAVTAVLAAIGSVSAAGGAMAYAVALAIGHGYTPAFIYDMKKVVDVHDDELRVELTPP